MSANLSFLVVDEDAVSHLADSLRRLPMTSTFASTLAPSMRGSREVCLRACLWASSICHSTKGGLSGTVDGELNKGWDFLIRAFTCRSTSDPESIAPDHVEKISEEELSIILSSAASDSRIALPDLARRAEILRQTARELRDKWNGSVSLLLDRADYRVGGESGAYRLLGEFTAFRDPLKKKSGAFLLTVHFGRLWKILDQESLEPMIDYHRMRLLCRTGCIKIKDENIRTRLESREPVAHGVEESIRRASAEICRMLVRITGLGMFECDNLLWAHARSCCRHQPVCTGGRLEGSSFYSLVDLPFSGVCEFQSWCPGSIDESLRSMWEPATSSEDY